MSKENIMYEGPVVDLIYSTEEKPSLIFHSVNKTKEEPVKEELVKEEIIEEPVKNIKLTKWHKIKLLFGI